MSFPARYLFIILPVLLLGSACQKKEKIGVEYRQQTAAETASAVTEIFNRDSPLPEKFDPEIEALFLHIAQVSRKDHPIEIERIFSSAAMLEALDSAGMLKTFKGRNRRQFEIGFRKGLENLNDSISQMAYDRHRIMRIENPSATVREVFVRHYDTDLNITFPMRWWLAKTTSGWRVFDFQDLSTGLRTVELMGIMIGASVGGKPEPWVTDFIPVLTRMRGLDLTDPEQIVTLQEPIEKLRQHTLPITIRTFCSTMMVAIHQHASGPEEVRNELQTALDGGHNSPLWHYQMANCLIAEEQHDKAIKELEKHAETFGWDSDALEILSDCHRNAGRLAEARAAALRGLEDSPGSPSCLASLAAASTPDQLRDPATAARFAQNSNLEATYEIALDYLLEIDATEQANALFSVFREKCPESELIEYYQQELELNPSTQSTE